jgi:hypothetical protein
MTPVSIYVDGFNLYHALLRFRDEKVKWLDLRALSQRVIRPKTEHIAAINYFSAYADWLPGPKTRHEEYVKALTALGVNCVLGHFKRKDRRCHKCGAKWVAHEEKETDVSIGIAMLNDAYKGIYEKAYLVTRDSDLLPAIKMICAEFPAKRIVAVAPPTQPVRKKGKLAQNRFGHACCPSTSRDRTEHWRPLALRITIREAAFGSDTYFQEATARPASLSAHRASSGPISRSIINAQATISASSHRDRPAPG